MTERERWEQACRDGTTDAKNFGEWCYRRLRRHADERREQAALAGLADDIEDYDPIEAETASLGTLEEEMKAERGYTVLMFERADDGAQYRYGPVDAVVPISVRALVTGTRLSRWGATRAPTLRV
jgi:hypothetical protein